MAWRSGAAMAASAHQRRHRRRSSAVALAWRGERGVAHGMKKENGVSVSVARMAYGMAWRA